MQAVTELDISLSDEFIVLTTVTVAARAAPGGWTVGVGDDRPSKLARRVRKDIGDWN